MSHCKMLVKLTPGVDFTNVFAHIFCERFSYERLFSSYVLWKTHVKTVGEIDPWGQFHQTLSAKQNIADAQCSAKNSKNFTNKI